MKINLYNLTHTLAHAAPLLGSAFAGPGGAAVGSILAAKFGGDASEPETLHALIQADPDAHLKLKQIELDHEVALQRLTLQAASHALETGIQDRLSARQRELDISKLPKGERDHTPAVLAYLLTLGAFVALAALFHCNLPEKNQMMVLGIVSSLITLWVGAVGYYHGSSMGSRLKDAGLMHHLHNPPDPLPARDTRSLARVGGAA